MVVARPPFFIERFVSLKPIKRIWADDFSKMLIIIISIIMLVFLCLMTIIESNGIANCEKYHGKEYGYDIHAGGDNAAKKCVNKNTGERKAIVVEPNE